MKRGKKLHTEGRINDTVIAEKAWDRYVASGNVSFLEVVYNFFYDKLFNYGRKHRIDDNLIEDAIQNLFVTLIKSRKKQGKIDKLFSYMLCSFRNELLRLASEQKGFSLSEGLQKYTLTEFSIEDEIITRETDLNIKNLLLSVVKTLPPSGQEILYMRFYQGLSYEEISEILSISIESCRTSVYRSLKTIRKDVEALKKSGALFYL
jgi:RNA polymerase sigma factor (sigma-70 family)